MDHRRARILNRILRVEISYSYFSSTPETLLLVFEIEALYFSLSLPSLSLPFFLSLSFQHTGERSRLPPPPCTSNDSPPPACDYESLHNILSTALTDRRKTKGRERLDFVYLFLQPLCVYFVRGTSLVGKNRWDENYEWPFLSSLRETRFTFDSRFVVQFRFTI